MSCGASTPSPSEGSKDGDSPAEAAVEPAPEPAQPEPRDIRPFAEQLRELSGGQELEPYLEDHKPDAKASLAMVEQGLERFVAARPGLEPDEASSQRAAIDGLLAWMDALLLRVEIREIEGLSGVSLEYAMGYEKDEIPAAERARLEQLAGMGVGFYEGDEATEGATIDYAGLREHLSPALSDQGRLYLEALSLLEDETGRPSAAQLRLREGKSVDASAQLGMWTALQKGPGGEAWAVEARAEEVLSNYLGRCATYEHTYFVECVVTPELRASYEGFVAAHPGTPEAAAVEHFLAGAEASGDRIAKEQKFDALLEQAMAKR